MPAHRPAPTAPTAAPGASAEPFDWRALGLCAQTDPELFYPEKGQPSAPAKAVCRRCDVASQCLQWALEHEERFGVWGGTSESERAKLRRARRTIGTAAPLPAAALKLAAGGEAA